jgi:hypothetical protein
MARVLLLVVLYSVATCILCIRQWHTGMPWMESRIGSVLYTALTWQRPCMTSDGINIKWIGVVDNYDITPPSLLLRDSIPFHNGRQLVRGVMA